MKKIGDYIEWKTIGGYKFSGIIIEDDSDSWIVKCTNGEVEAVTKAKGE